jgi:hypothetical protein
MIENTSQRDPLLHYLGATADGPTKYITDMEAAGQQQVVASAQIPTSGSDRLPELGFVLGEIDQRDPMFREATLPIGWSKQGSDHSMHSYIVDEHGRKRVNIFYKAAFYDRRASCTVLGLHTYLYDVREGAPLILDDQWATRDAVIEQLRDLIEREDESIALWRQHKNDDAVANHQKDRAAWQHLLDGLPASAS